MGAPLPKHRHKIRWTSYLNNDRDVSATAKELKLARNTVAQWAREFQERHGTDGPSADYWNEEEKLEGFADGAPSRDVLDAERQAARIRVLTAENKTLLRRAMLAEDLRSSVFKLIDPLEPIDFKDPFPSDPTVDRETVIINLSDIQYGEVVSLAEMNGVNSYNVGVANARLARLFYSVKKLTTKHWSGPKPARIILILGGDLISGDIHLELMKTNELSALPAARELVAHIKAGIDLLLKTHVCPIDIISIVGNHGRSTLKPEGKGAVLTSYDNLVSDFLEQIYLKEKRVTFFVPAGIDALFSVYGWQILATHGDRIGSRGGQGHIGPAATIARGYKRLIADYSAQGVHLDLILTGHFHCALELEEGYGNGSVVGPSEFSRDHRYRPRPAVQLYLTIHPKRGVTQARWIQVGDPSEGSIYSGRDGANERPKFRVRAVGV